MQLVPTLGVGPRVPVRLVPMLGVGTRSSRFLSFPPGSIVDAYSPPFGHRAVDGEDVLQRRVGLEVV